MNTVVAIDQGTTGTKTALLKENGDFQLISNNQHHQIHPQDGWVEHDPEELLSNIQSGIGQACASGGQKICAMGIDNQGETIVAWDGATGTPIYNAIVWQDLRTQSNIEKLKLDGAEELTVNLAGLPLDPYFSASKMKWILDHVPEANTLLKKKRLRIGTTDSFFLDRLTGMFATDVSTASRTSLMNLKDLQWDQELCNLFGVPVEVLPEIYPTIHDFGVAADFNCPVVANIVDQQAALYGHGCKNPGDTKITFGTGAFALANTGSKIVNEAGQGFLPTVAWQLSSKSISYAVDAGLYAAGSAIDWLIGTSLAESVDSLNHFQAQSAISRGLVFVPALSGLGCPYWERSASALWLGMDLNTSKEDLCQSVVEGIALRAGQLIDKLAEMINIPEKLPIDGGLSKNPYYCQFFADVVQRKIVIPETSEATAYGTAKLALLSCAELGLMQNLFIEKPPSYSKLYSPGRNMRQEKERFAMAVERCRSWRY